MNKQDFKCVDGLYYVGNIIDIDGNPWVEEEQVELIIEETTNEIYYVYDDVLMGSALWDYGQDAEIGVRGTQNINVSMNNNTYLQNNSCVHFYYTDCLFEDSCKNNS